MKTNRSPWLVNVAVLGLGGAGAALAADQVSEGKQIFRFDTFGDEQLWTDKLGLHQVVEKSVDPTTALKVGLKVDSEALPPGTLEKADLEDPATTVALLKLNAVVGLKAEVDANNHITRLGVTCALCHSTVDDSVKPGIGKRLDGWPNRDLDVGKIISLSPALTAEQKKVYTSWGPGMYDPRYNQDGKNTPLTIPPAYGLANIKNETYTAEGPISYWNAYVAVTQMGGQGNFSDQRLNIDVKHSPDMVTSKLPALRAYQHSLAAPKPKPGSYDTAGAARGRAVFDNACAICHVGASGTDNDAGKLHAPKDTGMDGAYAARTANRAYRTTPLRGLAHHPPYFHDGSAKTLKDVVAHYDDARSLKLSADQKKDLVEYLKSL
jgi:mono/diheme cytochrome c family protein